MNGVVPLRGHPTHDERSARLGMIVFVAGWTMMFGALLVAYLLLRKDAPAWPPPDAPRIELALPLVGTGVLVVSSATLQLGLVAIRNARQAALRRWLLVTVALGLAFLALQLGWFGRMAQRGLGAAHGIYAFGLYGLAGFHAVHVLAGLVGLGTLVPRASRGVFSSRAHVPVASWALYWHFVGVVWLVFFVVVFV